MKKWIVPVLAVTLLSSSVCTQAHAWPWGKKDKEETTQVKTQTKTQVKASAPKTAPKVDETPAASQAEMMPLADTAADSPKVKIQSPISAEIDGLKVEDPIESTVLPPDKTFVAIDDPSNPLGISTSAQKLNDSALLISQKKYAEAEKILNPLKDWLIDATEAHITLHKTLKQIGSAQVQAELEKQLALQFALLRDKAFFQLGMVSVGRNDYNNAIKNLSRVIQSQPRSAMGAQAYEVLQKIGFTERIQLRETKKEVTTSSSN